MKDPTSGDFYSFQEAERFVAQQLDGATPLDVVRERTERRFGAMLSAEALKTFIHTLERAGLLETARKRSRRRRRISGSLLYFRLALFDPNRLLGRLVPRVRRFFTPHFLVLSAASILLAAGITIGNWGALAQDLSVLYRLSAIPLVLAVAFVVGSSHEFAHGLTCKRLGGEVHDIGFMLVYFQPAFYCDVSDAWLFPEKSKRLWVGFSGPYFELFLWAVATVVWRLTDGLTWLNFIALNVIAVSGVKTVLNLNPFIKLDGYYLLSDYLELPNLRSLSFQYVGGLIGRLFGGGTRTDEGLRLAERRVYLCYGLAATVVSLGILAYVVVTTGSFLVENHQPAALLLFAGAAGIKSRRKIRKLFARSPDPSDESEETNVSDRPKSAPSSEPGETKGPIHGSWKGWIRWAAAAGTTLALLFCKVELRITGSFNVLPEQNADVRPMVEGIVETIPVDEGDTVRAGDVIARLSNETLVADLRKAEAEMREARAELRLLEAGPTGEEVDVATAGLAKAADRLKYARGRLDMLRPLHEQGLLSGRDFQELQEQAATADHELTEADGRLRLVVRGSRPEQIDATRARLERLETQKLFLEEQVLQLDVLSPVTGIVATPSRQLREMERQFVVKGALIAKVYELDTVTAQILIPEKEIADVSVGQKVVLRARAYPDRAFQGTVTSIATAALAGTGAGGPSTLATTSSASGAGSTKMLAVTTQIANDSLLLKPEMTGQAKVHCGKRRVVDLITRRLARTFKVEFWSWW